MLSAILAREITMEGRDRAANLLLLASFLVAALNPAHFSDGSRGAVCPSDSCDPVGLSSATQCILGSREAVAACETVKGRLVGARPHNVTY